MDSHITALFLIVEYIPMSPRLFCRLATTSRAFYIVFNSDRLWQRMNFLGVQTEIYQEYITQCSRCKNKRNMETKTLDCGCCLFDRMISPKLGIKGADKNVHPCYLWSNSLDIMMCAVRCNGMALAFASNSLRDNEKLVMEAVTAPLVIERTLPEKLPRGTSVYCRAAPLMYASSRLRGTRHVVTAAINRCGDSFHYASKNLQADKKLIYAAADNYCWFTDPQVLSMKDLDLCRLAAKRFPLNAFRMRRQAIWIPGFLDQVVQRHGHILLMPFASQSSQYNEFCTKRNILIAARTWGDTATELGHFLCPKDEVEVILEAIKYWPDNRFQCETIPLHLRDNYRIGLALAKKGCGAGEWVMSERVMALGSIRAVFRSLNRQRYLRYAGYGSYLKTLPLYNKHINVWGKAGRTGNRRWSCIPNMEFMALWLRDNDRTLEYYPDNIAPFENHDQIRRKLFYMT